MKGIAERAGVGRQTVNRWWSTKAEILLETAGVVLRAGVEAADAERGAKPSAARRRRLDRTAAPAAALLVGPVLFWIATGGQGKDLQVGLAVDAALAALTGLDGQDSAAGRAAGPTPAVTAPRRAG